MKRRFKDGQAVADLLAAGGAPATDAKKGEKEMILTAVLLFLLWLAAVLIDSRSGTCPSVARSAQDRYYGVFRADGITPVCCRVYVTKPVAHEDFVEAVRRLGLFLQVVKVPREDN